MSKRRFWTNEEVKYLEEFFPHVQTGKIARFLGRSYGSVSSKAEALGLEKSAAFRSNPQLNGHENLIIYGSAYRFQKGQEPPNKGMKQTEFMSAEAIERTKPTRFQQGHLPKNTREDGAISIRTCKGKWQYKWIRISVGNWKMLHRVVWEEAHGPIEKGYNVQFKDGDTLNCELGNLELVHRTESMRRNSIVRYPPEVRTTIRRISKLNKAIENEKQAESS